MRAAPALVLAAALASARADTFACSPTDCSLEAKYYRTGPAFTGWLDCPAGRVCTGSGGSSVDSVCLPGSKCSDVSSSSACTARPECKWCGADQWCGGTAGCVSQAKSCPDCATWTDPRTCANATSCVWCGSKCFKQNCPMCNAYGDPSSCNGATGCKWCGNTCANTCPTCDSYRNQQECTASGRCNWCGATCNTREDPCPQCDSYAQSSLCRNAQDVSQPGKLCSWCGNSLCQPSMKCPDCAKYADDACEGAFDNSNTQAACSAFNRSQSQCGGATDCNWCGNDLCSSTCPQCSSYGTLDKCRGASGGCVWCGSGCFKDSCPACSFYKQRGQCTSAKCNCTCQTDNCPGCSTYDSTQCSRHFNGTMQCRWCGNGLCSATCPACPSFNADPQKCKGATGCSWCGNGMCSAACPGCNYWKDPLKCGGAGCRWCSNSSVCSSSCPVCPSLPTESSCKSPECQWCGNSCGYPGKCPACSSFSDGKACAAAVGCEWCGLGKCSAKGSCPRCSAYDSARCPQAPGCRWCGNGLCNQTCPTCSTFNQSQALCQGASGCNWCGNARCQAERCPACSAYPNGTACSGAYQCTWCKYHCTSLGNCLVVDVAQCDPTKCDTCSWYKDYCAVHGNGVLERDEQCELNGVGCNPETALCLPKYRPTRPVSLNCVEDVCSAKNSSECLGSRQCSWCFSTSQCADAGAGCLECSNRTQQRCLSPCRWCSSTRQCSARALAECPRCADLERGACALYAGCEWSQYDDGCVAASAGLTCELGAGANRTDCYAHSPGCRWCQSALRCQATDASCPQCPERSPSPSSCALGGCALCNASSQCAAADAACTPCSGLPEHACGAAGTCAWCAAQQQCVANASECPVCADLNATDLCASAPGCAWCTRAGACVIASSAGPACDCAGADEAQCSQGCGWCNGTRSCSRRRSSGLCCPPCSSLQEQECSGAPACAWCAAVRQCFSTSMICVSCAQVASNSSCGQLDRCAWCPASQSAGLCVSEGQVCALGPTDGSDFPRWAIVAISAGGGGGLLLLCAAALALLVVSRRRSRRPKQRAMRPIEMNPVAMCPIPELGAALALGASPMRVSASPSALNFGVVAVDGPVGSCEFILRNSHHTDAAVVTFQPAPLPEAKCTVTVSPERATIAPGGYSRFCAKLAANCTAEFAGAIAVVRESVGHALLPFSGTGGPSTKLDWDEVAVDSVIAKGGCGMISRGTWRRNAVAIKEMHAALLHTDDMLEFRREIEVLNAIRSPYIVTFYGTITRDSTTKLIMEYAPLGSVSNHIHPKKGELSMKLKVKIALDCARGMQVLHNNGILHRDLKPGNLLLFSLGASKVNAKLTDFGSARTTADDEASKYTNGVGTPIYMAPEIIANNPYGPKADVYSYGVTLLELVTEEVPYETFENQFAITRFVSDGSRLDVPECPVADLIRKCWAQSQEERPDFNTVELLVSEAWKHRT
eukprot:m51a1_g8364 putative protein serine threonine (1457) ;mRNA; r:127127-133694